MVTRRHSVECDRTVLYGNHVAIVKVKVKKGVPISKGSSQFTLITSRYWNSISHCLISPSGECSAFSATVVIYTVPIFVPLGTHYCWVGRHGVDSKLAFYTWPALRESNSSPLKIYSNALTTPPCASRGIHMPVLLRCCFDGSDCSFI